MAKTKMQGSRSPDKTRFTCQAPDASEIFLAGTFNSWDTAANPMGRKDDGVWEVELELAPGSYEYKFVVDGFWCCEPGRDDHAVAGCVPNAFGTMNCVIEVGEAEGAQSSSAGK